MNFAAVYRAPVLFLCRNNGYAISLPTERQTATRTLAEKAAAYRIPASRIDGNDVLGVWRAVREGVQRASEGGGPSFIELMTYRRGGHSTSDDPRVYRDELWLLNSGRGDFGRIDRQRGLFEPVTFCPGYARGLAFIEDYAVIGISRPREDTFAGLPLDDELSRRGQSPGCGWAGR